jgi:hypothetical protein
MSVYEKYRSAKSQMNFACLPACLPSGNHTQLSGLLYIVQDEIHFIDKTLVVDS